MKSIKRFAKSSLSIVLCLAMVMTTMIFFDIGITKPEAKVTNTATTLQDVLFYVPEAIYLRPVSNSWGTSTKSKFHFFVENKVLDGSGNLMSQPEAQSAVTTGNGKVYFKYANGTYKNLEIRWLSTDLLSVYNDGGALLFGNSGGDCTQPGGVWKEISRDMESPTLASGQSCVLEWKLTYHDNVDDLDKSVVAYSYVYQPYVVPVATGTLAFNQHGGGDKDNRIGQIAWITGFHKFARTGPVSGEYDDYRHSRYGASGATGQKGFLPFLTPGNLDGINGSGATGSYFATKDSGGGTPLNAYFASTNTSYDFFYASQHGYNNQQAYDWHVEPDAADMSTNQNDHSALNQKAHQYSGIERDPGGTNDTSVWKSRVNSSVGEIYIDTSRYTNLSQVPNLGVGMMITHGDGSKDGAWYVADFTDWTQKDINGNVNLDLLGGSQDTNYSSEMSKAWDDKGPVIAGYGSMDKRSTEAKNCEVKYAGVWNRAVISADQTSSTQMYKIKSAAYSNRDKDGALACSIMNMQAQQYNKKNLRTAVYNATREFARLGVSDNSYNSHYYYKDGDEKPDGTTVSGSKYTAFINAYKAAYSSLIYVNMAPSKNPDTLANELNTALANLKADVGGTGTTCHKTGTAVQYNVGIIKNTNDTENGYRIVKIAEAKVGNKETLKTTYNYGDQIKFEDEKFEGYSYLGFVNLGDTTIGVESMVQERLLAALPSFSDSDAQYAHGIVTDPNTCQTTITKDTNNVTESSKRAEFKMVEGTATFKTALNSNISLVYFYEITHTDVLLGNEFDFDSYYWTRPNAGSLEVDHLANSVIFTAGSGADNYTQTYAPGGSQPGYLELIPGRTYKLSFDYENLSGSKAPIRVMSFDYPIVPSTKWTTARDHYHIAEANGSGTYTDTFVMTEGCEYFTLRLGIADYKDVAAANKKVKFSNIRIYDVTDLSEKKEERDTALPTPPVITAAQGASIASLAPMTKDGYQFVGWSTDKLDNGNGDANAKVILPFTVPSSGENEILYPIWRATDVLFGNELDFDGYVWEAREDGSSLDVNYTSNTLVLKAGSNDSYTALYENTSDQKGVMTLVPGRVYEFSCKAENLSSMSVTASMHLFTFDNEELLGGVVEHNKDFTSTEVPINGNDSLMLKGSFKIPEGRQFATIRVGTITQGAKIRFSEIYIRDVSTFVAPHHDLDSSITRPDQIYKSASESGIVNDFPTIKRDGYDFIGWYDKNDPDTIIKEVTLEEENIQLFPKWGDAYSYTIKFEANGGTGSMADMPMEYDKPKKLNKNTFTKTSWAFRGWNTKADGTGQAYVDEDEINIAPENNGGEVKLYAQWSLNEVVFGNLFDFDEFTWRRFSYSTGIADYTNNTVKLVSEGDYADGEINGRTDAYSNDYNTEYQNGVMTLIPGRTYEFSCTVENLSAKKANASLYFFTFTTEGLTDEITEDGYNKDFISVEEDINANSSGEVKGSFKIPEGRSFATIRVGTHTPEATVVFSEICVRDITDFTKDLNPDSSVTKANPLSKYDELSGLVTDFPQLERNYYTFAGWGTDMKEDGNGTNKVEQWEFKPEDIGNKHLYPIWVPNVVVVRMHLGAFDVDQEFLYGEEQALEKAQDTSSRTVDFYDGDTLRKTDFIGTKFDFWSESASNIEKLYSDAQLVTNPGGADRYKTASEKIYDLYAIWAVAENSDITAPFIEKENASGEYVLKGWAETNGSTTVKYKVNDKFVPEDNMSLYAVWHKLEDTDNKVADFVKDYKGEQEVVSGIVIGADGVAKAEKIVEVLGVYDTKDFDNAKSEYDAAKNAYESNKNAATNNALLGAIGNVESSAAKVPSSNGSETKYLDNFEIKYAEGVEGAVPAGKYSVADMNLNHYTKEELDKVSTEWGTARTYT
ncbi:MAG: InlB B-repeat-containing protein, partial [Clostridia bacterium]|nr:InlB B-repeat-containing protein [Clostridia bacterium]